MKRSALWLFLPASVLAAVAVLAELPGQSGPAQPALRFANNANTLVQLDSFGDYQNVAYYDSDSGLFLGPGADPRTTIYANVPINLFRRHVFVDFEEAKGLDPRCRFAGTGGATAESEWGFCRLRTAAAAGSTAELTLPNVSAPAYAGQRLYFYLRSYPAGNLRLEFGLRAREQPERAIGFARVDRGGPTADGGEYVAFTAAGPDRRTETPSGAGAMPGGDHVRRLFCIDVTGTQEAARGQTGRVAFYVGDEGGVLHLRATHETDVPDITADDGQTQHLMPYVRLESTDDAAQEVAIDAIYGVLLR